MANINTRFAIASKDTSPPCSLFIFCYLPEYVNSCHILAYFKHSNILKINGSKECEKKVHIYYTVQ